jgi:hypothetical protein
MALCDRVNESTGLAIKLAEPSFKSQPLGIRVSSKALSLFVVGPDIFDNDLRMPHLGFEAGDHCTFDSLEVERFGIGAGAAPVDR